MSRFNTAVKVTPDTVNLALAPAYSLNDKTRLVTLLLGSFLKDQFYRSGDETLAELQALVATVEPTFAARAAIYARDTFGMRSVSHVVAAELCRYVKGEQWLRHFLRRVVIRPDDVTEILAYWLATYGKPIPNAMKRGLGDALSDFDGYRLGKYKAEAKKVSLVDAANLCHPKHTEALAALMNGTLVAPDTWEVELTRAGQQEDVAAAKAAVWERLLREKQLGYFALLRNLRNITEQAPSCVPMAAEQLRDPDAVRCSRVLPFRFLTAWEAVDVLRNRDLMLALSAATNVAVQNVPELPGRTLVAVDGSGSMQGYASHQTSPIAIAALFAAALYRKGDADVLIFDDRTIWLQLNPADSVMTNAQKIRDRAQAGGTNFNLIFDAATRPYDRVVILSDMQAWMKRERSNNVFFRGWGTGTSDPATAAKDYRRRTGADPHIFCFDLAGYGTAQFPEPKVTQLCGWSDKAFDLMLMLERGQDGIVKAVEEVVL